jgi:hypothetical protein
VRNRGAEGVKLRTFDSLRLGLDWLGKEVHVVVVVVVNGCQIGGEFDRSRSGSGAGRLGGCELTLTVRAGLIGQGSQVSERENSRGKGRRTFEPTSPFVF